MKKRFSTTTCKFKHAAVTSAIAASVMMGTVATPVMAAGLDNTDTEPVISESATKEVKITKEAVAEAKTKMDQASEEKALAQEELQKGKEACQQAQEASDEAVVTAKKAFQEERDEAQALVETGNQKVLEAQATLEDAKTAVAEAEKEAAKAQQKVAEAQQELTEAESDSVITEEDVTKAAEATVIAQNALETAKAALEEKQAEAKLAQEALETAKSEKTNADANLVVAEAALADARKTTTDAEALVHTAQEELQAVIDLKEGTIDITQTVQYQAFQKTEQELDGAKAAEETAKLACAEMKEAQETADRTLKEAEEWLETTKAAFTEATSAYDTALEEQIADEHALAEAQASYDAAVNRAEIAKTSLEEKQETKLVAQTDVETAKAAKEAAEAAVTAAEAAVAAAQTAFEEAEAKYQEGAKGFYTWVVESDKDVDGDAANALDVLDDYTGTTGVQIGLEGDATSIENIKICLEFLKKSNELRATDDNFTELGDLRVNHLMMAIAQSNADCSHSPNAGHLQHYYVGENLAWGYSDPYRGWYDQEKYYYDNDILGVTGHYLNIVNDNYYVTGLGLSTTADDTYGSTFSQVYQYQWGAFAANAMSVADYEALLDEYLETIDKTNLQKVLDDANASLMLAKSEADSKATVLLTAETTLTEATASLDNAQQEKNAADVALEDTTNVLDEKVKDLEQAKASLETMKNQLEFAYADKTEAEKICAEALNTVENAHAILAEKQNEYEDAMKATKDAQTIYDAAKKAVDDLTSDEAIGKLEAVVTEANQQLEDARKELSMKETMAADAKAALENAVAVVTAAETDLTEKQESLEAAEKDIEAKEQAFKLAQEDQSVTEAAYDNLLFARAVLDTAKTEAETAVTLMVAANERVVLAERGLSEAQEALQVAIDKSQRAQALDYNKALTEPITDPDFMYLCEYVDAVKAAQVEQAIAISAYKEAVEAYNTKAASYTAAVQTHTYLLANYEEDVVEQETSTEEVVTKGEDNNYTSGSPDTSDPMLPGYVVTSLAAVAGVLAAAKRRKKIK